MTEVSISTSPAFDAAVRKGSPFADGSARPGPLVGRQWRAATIERESIGEGVWRETATAATFAAWMLLGFVAVGWAWFPVGGIAIALLGIAMSLMGLSSRHVKLAIAAMTIHAAMLCGCYFNSMS
jgi:hypothetical protein